MVVTEEEMIVESSEPTSQDGDGETIFVDMTSSATTESQKKDSEEGEEGKILPP